MATEKQRVSKAWLLAREAEGFTQDQIAEQLSPFLPPKGINQATIGRILIQSKEEDGYPTGKTLRGITALLECEEAEAERSVDEEGTGQDECVTTLPAAAQPVPHVVTEDAQHIERAFVETPGSTLEEKRTAQREKFLARQAEVDRDIEAVYKRLAAAGIVNEDSDEIYGDARFFHAYAIKFKYLDCGAEIVGFGPPDFECPCGSTLQSHRKNVSWEQRTQRFAVPPGSERPDSIGLRPTAMFSYEPCLDEKWLRGEVLYRKLTIWRRLRELTPQWWKEQQLPLWPSRSDITWFKAVLLLEAELLGPREMLMVIMPILDWRPFVYDHEAMTMSMDDSLAHQRAKLKSLKRRARIFTFIGKALNATGHLLLLSVAALVAAGVWVQDLWWSGAVSSPVAVLIVLALLAAFAWQPRTGSTES